MISKFTRARFLVDNFDEYRGHLNPLLDAIAGAFSHAPDAVDTIIQETMNGSDSQSRDRGYEIYRRALSGRGRRTEERIPADSKMHCIAFQRVLWAATADSSDAVLRTAQQVFRSHPYELEEITRAELDNLIPKEGGRGPSAPSAREDRKCHRIQVRHWAKPNG